MKTDIDLQILKSCSNDELRTLCDILTHDEDGNIRISEQLTGKDSYNLHYPNNCKEMWQDIAKELCLYGGNTFLNIFMRDGNGPAYESIVSDVCKQLDIETAEFDSVEDMELKLIQHVTEEMLDNLSQEQLKDIMKELHIRKKVYTKQAVMVALLATRAINKRLFVWIFEYILRMVGDMLVGRGVMYATQSIIRRGANVVFGPVGWLILGGWTAWDVAGPAYRVTIPAVLQVAYLRMKHTIR